MLQCFEWFKCINVWFLGHCYAAAEDLWMVHCCAIARDVWLVAKALLCSCWSVLKSAMGLLERYLWLLGQCYAKCSECFDVHCLTVARIFNLFIQLLANFIFLIALPSGCLGVAMQLLKCCKFNSINSFSSNNGVDVPLLHTSLVL